MTDNEQKSDSDPQNDAGISLAYYSPGRPVILTDGTIEIPTHGCVWDGSLQLKPDQPDYQFWLWMLERWPYHSDLAFEDLPVLKEEYARAGSPTSALPTPCMETADDGGPDIMAWTFWTNFRAQDAKTQADGTIAVPVGGMRPSDEIWDNLRELGSFKLIEGDAKFWNGSLEIYPNHADYQFWQWLIQRWPRHSLLGAEDIPTLKAEHMKARGLKTS